jgi:hypothetical protein
VEDVMTADANQPRLVGPPTRRRLPIVKIVVAVLAVLIAGMCWLARPRIDSRFVGTWRLEATDKHGEHTVTFGSDGRLTGFAHEVVGAPLATYDVTLNWRNDGDQLVVDVNPSNPSTARELMDAWVDRMTGNVAEFRYVVVELSPELIRFHRLGIPHIVTTYRRVDDQPATLR